MRIYKLYLNQINEMFFLFYKEYEWKIIKPGSAI